ncbi:hypothetical protein H4Q26_007309 [Puccinia striiformis f. sp. tritici PST-130]|nr:hypothetical protein H4Q26_007309 [Puccinia striiformis f. sp. tritici PST-130]
MSETDNDQYSQVDQPVNHSNSTQEHSDQPLANVLNSLLLANLPNQVHRKSVRKGFHFTVMVVGESGLGNRLSSILFFIQPYILLKNILDLMLNGRGRLPSEYLSGNIEARFDGYLEQENRVNRAKIVDNRIHACIYFIEPTGHSLKLVDVEFMKCLHTKVNLIPVIAKADTMTDDEIAAFKQRILADIAFHNIRIYEARRYDKEDEETIAENEEIMRKIPFAIVGSDSEVQTADGRQCRGRQYPWGIIEDHTANVLYENYRTEKLLSIGVTQDHSVFQEVNPAAKMAEERALHEAKLAKMEAEMKMVFQQKVAEKEAKLKQSEEELYHRHRDMKEALEKQKADLEDKKRRLESGRL